MMFAHGSGELRRVERLADMVTAQLSAIRLGSCVRDLCRYDMEEPLQPGEIALRGRVDVLTARNLLIERGFQPSGWSGAGGEREPVYSRAW